MTTAHWQPPLWPLPGSGSIGTALRGMPILDQGFNKPARDRQCSFVVVEVGIPASVHPSPRSHRRGPGGPKGALWHGSSALAHDLGPSLSLAGRCRPGPCLGSGSAGLCLWGHAGSAAQRIYIQSSNCKYETCRQYTYSSMQITLANAPPYLVSVASHARAQERKHGKQTALLIRLGLKSQDICNLL